MPPGPFLRCTPRSPVNPTPCRRLEQLPWPAVQAAAASAGSTVVWPFGALEQHGPQLPLGTDALFADQILDRVLAGLDPALPIWRLPLQSIGFSPEHQSFPGTVTLPAELLIAQVVAVGGQLAASGFERLLLFNGHGGQIALLQVAARQLRAAHPAMAVLPCFVWSGPPGLAELLPEPERSQGLHAGQAETSLMLHLAPDQVGPQRPLDGVLPAPPPPGWSLEGAVPEAWLTADLSHCGVIGDARAATPELGAALCERLVCGWQRLLHELMASDWPPRQPLPRCPTGPGG